MKIETSVNESSWHYDHYDPDEVWQAIASEHGVAELPSVQPEPIEATDMPNHAVRQPRDYSDRIPPDAEAWLKLSESAIARTMKEIFVPGYEVEDLRQDLIEGLLRGIPDYDPTKSQPSTFAATLIYNSAVNVLRWHTAQKRTPGSRVHVKTKDRYEKLRNGLLELGVPVTASHFEMSKDPADCAVENESITQLMRLMSDAGLSKLETHAVLDNLFYNGTRRKNEKIDGIRLSKALVRAKEKMSKVPVDHGFTILSET